MAFVKDIFDKNFIEYSSYVIRSRAIPDLADGLKPVQRRIMHTLFSIDDGRFQKVATVAGRVMAYHPHGNTSIEEAIVVLANREIFISRQGNYGNILTGAEAAASRYIECRVHPVAKKILYNPNITEYIPSYDSRGKEPLTFRAKLPLLLLGGSEGIAVGMSTKILPYNLKEVIDAEIKALKGEEFQIYPDDVTGGLIDVSNYNDGNGKIVTRAKFDLSDEKKIIITELPLETTSQSIRDSIDAAYKAGKIKISSVDDYTTDKCNIEIKLPRGVYAKDVEESLYAYTDCEKNISCQMLVIKDNIPVQMTATEVIKYYAKNLLQIIKDELEWDRGSLTEKLHLRTLERIFIEERIYKKIETMKTSEDVSKAVKKGFDKFKAELIRDINDDDVKHLLEIPIRRISLFDINKNKDEVREINARLKEIAKKLRHLTDCAVEYLNSVITEIGKYTVLDPEKDQDCINPKILERQTTITKFTAVDVKAIVKRETPLRYDDKGYLGTKVPGGREILKVTPYDRILIVRKSGIWGVCDVAEKLFVDNGMYYCNYAEKEIINKVIFTIIYRDPKTMQCYIKRCHIDGWIMNRDYNFAPEGMEVLHVDTRENFNFNLKFRSKPHSKTASASFNAKDFKEKGLKAAGIKLDTHEVSEVEVDNNGELFND